LSESFVGQFNRVIGTVLEASDVRFPRSVLAQLWQFLKVCYDFAIPSVQTDDSSEWVPDFIVRGLGLELEEDNVSDHGNRGVRGSEGGWRSDRRKSESFLLCVDPPPDESQSKCDLNYVKLLANRRASNEGRILRLLLHGISKS